MKKFTCVLKVLPLPAYGVQWNVQVKEPAQIYNTFWKFPLKLFQTCEEKVKFRHLMNAKVNARHQKFPHPYAQSGMREGLIRAGGGRSCQGGAQAWNCHKATQSISRRATRSTRRTRS